MAAPAYPCARCGSPLRWVAATSTWACDACKVSYPVQGAPPPAAMPAPMPTQARTRRALSPKQKILVAAGAGSGVLLLAIALVLALGGPKSGGKPTPDELFRAAIDRAIAGDDDGLFALAGADKILSVVDCSDGFAKHRGDYDSGKDWRTQMVEEQRHDLTRHLDKWKGLTVTIDSVEPKDDPDVQHAGSSEGGCEVKTDITEQRFRVKVSVKGADGSTDDAELRFRAMKVDGLWYLDDMPSAPAAGGLARLRRIKDAMCACHDTACAQGVQKDLEQFGRDNTDASGSSDDMEAQRLIINELTDCEVKAMSSNPY